MPFRFTTDDDTWRAPATAIGLPYQQAIVRAGGVPVAVPPLFDDADAGDFARDVMSRVDALCLPGGPDVGPHRYGATSVHEKVYGVRDEHDTLDIALAQAAIELERPLLAICRGHQVLNVALGGTLHQHLSDAVGDDVGARHYKQHNDIELMVGSKVAVAMGTTRPHGHCVHHQAIETLGAGLLVTAWSGDVIEGVELQDQGVVGVQWHPEDDAATDVEQQALFDGF